MEAHAISFAYEKTPTLTSNGPIPNVHIIIITFICLSEQQILKILQHVVRRGDLRKPPGL